MTNKPIQQFKAGNISGAIWENEREKNGTVISFKTVSMRRSWYDKDKKLWRDETINLHKTDIPKMIVILNRIQEEILLNDKGEDENNE